MLWVRLGFLFVRFCLSSMYRISFGSGYLYKYIYISCLWSICVSEVRIEIAVHTSCWTEFAFYLYNVYIIKPHDVYTSIVWVYLCLLWFSSSRVNAHLRGMCLHWWCIYVTPCDGNYIVCMCVIMWAENKRSEVCIALCLS